MCREKQSFPRCVAGSLVLCGAALLGDPASAGDWDLSVALSSNYLVHGLTRSSNEPAVQGHLGLTGDQSWSVGVWASTVNLHPGPGPDEELDFYVAKHWQLSRDWRVAGQLTHYEFREDSQFLSYDYSELSASVSFRDALALSLAVAPDYSAYTSRGVARDRAFITSELSGQHAVTRHLRLTAGVGYADLDDLFGTSYWYWSAGAELAWRRISLGVAYVGADAGAERLFGTQRAADTWVTTLAYRIL
jgi:uncharacterized protein (TIGR02001 family)